MLPSDTLSFRSAISSPSSHHRHHHLCFESQASVPSASCRPAGRRNSVVCFPLGARASAVCSRPCTRNLYDLLELSPGAGLADIKQAYRLMARKYHPDVCPPHQAQESTRRFIEIQEAFATLSDPTQRAIYDHAMQAGRILDSVTGNQPWMHSQKDAQPSDWRSQWRFQLSELKLRSSMKAQTANSWGARMRQENGLC